MTWPRATTSINHDGLSEPLDERGPSTMNKTIHAIYANGVFRPFENVDLPEQTPVEFELRVLPEAPKPQTPMSEGLAKIYEILGRRYSSGFTDTAERHNEHQP
jgi:predicted DNA-binding antitoxin AbrB/MazE fold protein